MIERATNGVVEVLIGPSGVTDLDGAEGVMFLGTAKGVTDLTCVGIGIGESGVTLLGIDNPDARCLSGRTPKK